MRTLPTLVVGAAIILGGAVPTTAQDANNALAVLVPGGGTYTRPISTGSEITQTFFDQGLRMAWSFYFPEPIASYQEAARHDPDHPMPYFGIAHAAGPNPNSRYAGLPDDPQGAGFDAIETALSLIDNASPAERDLINALYVLRSQVVDRQFSDVWGDTNLPLIGTYPQSHRIHAPHALDFVRYASILQGNYAGALDAAERNAPDADDDQSVIFNAQERVVHIWVVDKIFGRWDKLLTMEQTHTGTPYLDGMWSYVTGSALVATGQFDGAEAALTNIRRQAADETADSTGVGPTPASHLLRLAGFALEGELKEARGDLEGAIEAYDQAVQTQDANNYTEPPDWSQSMRLYLGAVLLSAERHEDAETVFRQDLEWNQQSGWATYGLYQALTGQGRSGEAEIVRRQFESYWRNADVTLERPRI